MSLRTYFNINKIPFIKNDNIVTIKSITLYIAENTLSIIEFNILYINNIK